MFDTPQGLLSPQGFLSPELQDVQQRVLSAAVDTAQSNNQPKKFRTNRDFVFRTCSNHAKVTDKLAKRLNKALKKDPTLLLCRSRGMGVPAAEVVLQAAKIAADDIEKEHGIIAAQPFNELHLHRDLEGKCALAIASEYGSIDMVKLLVPLYKLPQPLAPTGPLTSPPPIDLLGRTPLGHALTSPNPKAKSNKKGLEEALFSPMDPSILGAPKNAQERMHVFSSLQIAYGYADMPGMRIDMEDSICTETWSAAGGQEYSLLGVCDGHGDSGKVSEFVATNVSTILRECMRAQASDDTASVDYWKDIWSRACLKLDADLKDADLDGGSTAVLALITKDLVVVANVGDSRCVLIQSAPADPPASEVPMVETVTSDSSAEQASGETSEAPELKDETTPLVEAANEEASVDQVTNQLAKMEIARETKTEMEIEIKTIVTPLSFDHKPELPAETARVENAGLKVATNTYEMNGKEVTYHKIAKSKTDMLATSRSFGDFDYKGNTTLLPEEQAVSCVADVQVHKRDPKRDMYLVLACDGIWDVMENEDVMDFVTKEVKNNTSSTTVLPEVGDALTRKCLDLGSTDNMSTILVSLDPEKQELMSPVGELPAPKTLQFGEN
ncbi:MAG: hypothetical protein SGARI_001006 [Bacillariaceae sp.]